ncbi:MAG: serine/threonine protein kinase [Kofleriaceae bacterium]|jgi:serine/threonine protein kinase|nr:serine/threonine protein kinase [Kofleriaceae bacterium]MBP6839669.1 serine/threonine protein kinase [Kofleriaceae bacterium]MBP9203071.1 serine/threonine protein kinase [Kofleriaceae bacterium]
MGPLTEAVTRRLELAEVPSSAGRGAPSEEDADGLVIASAPAPAWRRPGPGPTAAGLRRIGPYEIVAELARGGMGVVYLCRRAGEAGFERLLAVKHLHTHLAGDAEFVAMLLDEARLAARIHHHNVASVVELGYFEWGYYLVMPYVEGCALGELLARNPDHRPPSLLVPILIEALDGLHAAHVTPGPDGAPAGVVHRDVSPANILVGVDGAARITDFGVAKARTRITSSAQGTIKGTLCYAAPEVYRGGPIDARADVFAAGAVLWSALTGRRLFRGDNDADTMQRVLTMPVPPASGVGLRPPAILDAILAKALARDPAERYQSAAEMAAALRAAALGAGLLGAPSEIAGWVGATFAAELDGRHRLLRDADRRRDPASVVVLPRLAEPSRVTAAPPPLPATAIDIARFVAVVTAAFFAGLLTTLAL